MSKASCPIATVRQAVSTGRCDASSAATLRQILLVERLETASACEGNENKDLKRRGARKGALEQNEDLSANRKNTVTKIKSWSKRDRFVAATEIVNAALSHLTTVAKTRQENGLQESQVVSKTTNSLSAPAKPLSKTPLQARSGNENRKRDVSKAVNAGPEYYAAVCCALGLSCLRELQKEETFSKVLPSLHVENGMVSLVGKMLVLGFRDLVIDELQHLSNRFCLMRETRVDRKETIKPCAGDHSITSLLEVPSGDFTEAEQQIIISHQLYVLQVVLESRITTEIEQILRVLRKDSECSPLRRILSTGRKQSQNLRSYGRCMVDGTRMLQSLSHGESNVSQQAHLQKLSREWDEVLFSHIDAFQSSIPTLVDPMTNLVPFIDCALACCKRRTDAECIDWNTLDKVLSRSQQLLGSREAIAHSRKISNLYWSQYLKPKHNGDTTVDEVRFLAVSNSVAALKDAIIGEQAAGFFPVKMEVLARLQYKRRQYQEAYCSLINAMTFFQKTGLVAKAVTALQTKSLHLVSRMEEYKYLDRILKALNKTAQHVAISLWEIPTLTSDMAQMECAAILEWFLDAQLDQAEPESAERKPGSEQDLCQRLMQLYNHTDYPLRRKRIATTLWRLESLQAKVLPQELEDICTEPLPISLGKDSGLQSYATEQEALSKALACLKTINLDQDRLQHALVSWQNIVASCSSESELLKKINRPRTFTAVLQAVADYCQVRGLDELSLTTHRILQSYNRLESNKNTQNLAETLVNTGKLLLRMNLPEDAHSALLEAKSYLAPDAVTTTLRLEWHLTYAQALISCSQPQQGKRELAVAQRLGDSYRKTASSSRLERETRLQNTANENFIAASLAFDMADFEKAIVLNKHVVRIHEHLWRSRSNTANLPVKSVPSIADDLDTGFQIQNDLDKADTRDVIATASSNATKLWPLLRPASEAMLLQIRILVHIGNFSEARHYVEKVLKMFEVMRAPRLLLKSLVVFADLVSKSGSVDEGADTILKASRLVSDDPSQDLQSSVQYHLVRARILRQLGEHASESEALETAKELISKGSTHSSSQYRNKNDRSEGLAESMGQLNISEVSVKRKASSHSKAPPKRRTLQAKASRTKELREKDEDLQVHGTFHCLKIEVLEEMAVSFIYHGKLQQVLQLIQSSEDWIRESCLGPAIELRLRQALTMAALAQDLTFNSLVESTISLPSLSSICAPKKATQKVELSEELSDLFRAFDSTTKIYDRLIEESSTIRNNELSILSAHVHTLLSAAAGQTMSRVLQPAFAAYYLQSAQVTAHHREQSFIRAEKVRSNASEQFGSLEDSEFSQKLSAAQFQHDYIDIIPSTWTTIALSLSEDREELYVTRYEPCSSPFILRLPMVRHKLDDDDEEEPFTFDDGKRELLDIISTSDSSTRTKNLDLTKKGAKTAWWAEREALDSRLHDLLVNMENIWFGGFRGIFSPGRRHPDLLARFQKSFHGVLDRHLPSRQGSSRRGKATEVTLDHRVLELFISLDKMESVSLEMDDALSDLLYFVVDMLLFNGERNAYDEIDFDALIVDTLEIVRAYHTAAAEMPPVSAGHTILILDKQLLCFPWESMPCLQGQSVSRMPSLAALRDRILHSQVPQSNPSAQHIRSDSIKPLASRSSHSYILNPSGDLKQTESTVGPSLRSMPNTPQKLIAGRDPTEAEWTACLTSSDLFLYFGHGCGNQYIRDRTVRRLDRLPRAICLMGCSSGAVTEYGAFEPRGTILDYLNAGCGTPSRWPHADEAADNNNNNNDHDHKDTSAAADPSSRPCLAICVNLWDVTDRDIDRFTLKLGTEWGLWDAEVAAASGEDERGAPKTPGKHKIPRKRAQSQSSSTARGGQKAVEARGCGTASLVEAVAKSRDACILRYLNGAAPVVYGIPVWIDG